MWQPAVAGLEGKYCRGGIRPSVRWSTQACSGWSTRRSTPYWRCIPNGKPDPVVVENMRAAYNGLSPELRLGLIGLTLHKCRDLCK